MRIVENITELIGNTPMLKLNNYCNYKKIEANIIAKLESFNPGGSVKDRIGKSMIEDGEKRGLINKDTIIIEPTSGNTGIGLAIMAASKGYKLMITMPETFSIERRKLLKALGAELVLTPGEEGMAGAIRKAEELSMEYANSFIPYQFQNPANPDAHRRTTAEEIWRDTEGNIDIFVAGAGSGGTITGVGEVLKKYKPDIKIVAIEPYSSPVISGGKPGPHKLQGLGPGFVPDVLNTKIIDEIYKVKNEEAYEITRLLWKLEGIFVGISSGAATFAATELAKREENKGKNIVVIMPDTGERYITTDLFSEN